MRSRSNVSVSKKLVPETNAQSNTVLKENKEP